MRALSTSLCSFLVLAACAPSAPSVEARGASKASRAIINGEMCAAEVNPTALALMVDATLDFGQFGGEMDITTVMCTGTLIAPDVVLTAAHCVDATGLTGGFGEVRRADFYVSFESDLGAYAEQSSQEPLPLPASAIPVAAFVAHPEFRMDAFNQGVNGPGDFKDVGLLFLAAAVEDIEPEVVITADEASAIVAGAAVEIAGWGQQVPQVDFFTPPPPGTVGKKVCGTSTINEVGDYEMQVGADQSTTRKCHGDSGGPTYLEVDTEHDRTRRVVGITSHAYDQSDCAKGGVDTRVDVWLSWIDTEMRAACAHGTRTWCDVAGVIPPGFYDAGGPGAGEGEGEGEGDDEDDRLGAQGDDDDRSAPNFGCSGAPSSTLGGLALVLLALRRRRP